MKNYTNFALTFVYALLLQNCVWSAHDEKLNDRYYLSAMDVKNDMEIIYKDSQDYMLVIVSPTVFAIGQNDQYIIAKQHPKSSNIETDKVITNYFIIPLKNKVNKSPEKNIYGPLTKNEFDQKIKELNIENVGFTKVF